MNAEIKPSITVIYRKVNVGLVKMRGNQAHQSKNKEEVQ